MSKTMIDKMVDRFLSWKLPKDFAPDAGISFKPSKPECYDEPGWWPIGTNLFTGEQARCMLEHVVGNDMNDELERLRGVVLRATAELATVEYDNDPPSRVITLLDEMRAINRSAL